MSHGLRRQAELPALGQVHQQDAAARRVHLLAPQRRTWGTSAGRSRSARSRRAARALAGGAGRTRRGRPRRGPRPCGGGGATRSRSASVMRPPRGEAARRERARGVELPLDRAHELLGDGIEVGPHQRAGGGGRAAQRDVPAERLDVRSQRAHPLGVVVQAQLADADVRAHDGLGAVAVRQRQQVAQAAGGTPIAATTPSPPHGRVACAAQRASASSASSTRASGASPAASAACRSAPSSLDSTRTSSAPSGHTTSPAAGTTAAVASAARRRRRPPASRRRAPPCASRRPPDAAGRRPR